jgi:hypothetical protein
MPKKIVSLAVNPAALAKTDSLQTTRPEVRTALEQVARRARTTGTLRKPRIENRGSTENGPRPSVLEEFLEVENPLDRSDAGSILSESNLMGSLALASETVLENFRMSRLASAANFRKDMNLLFEEVVNQLAEAKLAELLLHYSKNNPRKG